MDFAFTRAESLQTATTIPKNELVNNAKRMFSKSKNNKSYTPPSLKSAEVFNVVWLLTEDSSGIPEVLSKPIEELLVASLDTKDDTGKHLISYPT